MSLLDELQALDLSAIVEAKDSIAVTVNGQDLVALVGDGAAMSVLGDLGAVIQTAVDGFEHPESLVEPILTAFTALLREVDAQIPLGDYVEAITTAARVVADLIAVVSGDPKRIGFGGKDIGDALERVGGQFGDHAAVVSGRLSRFRALVQTVEKGLPSEPAALVAPSLEILLPFPTASIDAVGEWTTQLTARLDAIIIDPNLTNGLVRALGDVRVAADAGDAPALRQSLTALAEVRASTVRQLAAALRSVAGAVSSIRLDDGLRLIADLRGTLSAADDTVFDLLDSWRAMIAGVRASVERIDAATAMTELDKVLDLVESTASDVILTGIDGSVEVVKQWLRDLLREIPIRQLRMQVSTGIAQAAKAIADADLDAPAEAVRGLLTQVSSALTEADPAALVQVAVTELETVVRNALDDLDDAMGSITASIGEVADEAQQVLLRAVDGLREFREVVDEITVAIEDAGIAEAAAQIAASLDELQQQVSELVANAPMPDALRDAVEQLVETLESIDLDAAIGGPLREVASQLQIPGEIATTVRDGLAAVADAIQSLVPTDVVAELEAMMAGVLGEIEKLDLSQLNGSVTELLDGAASVFDAVDVAELIAPVADVFAEIVALVDRVHPRIILRPAIDLYSQILGAIPVPSPEAITTRAASVMSQAGEAVARTAVEPARRAVSADATTPPAGESPRGGLGPAREDQPPDLRPGDIVRLIGFLPAKLREALSRLGAGPAGEVLAAISGGLSSATEGLRDVRDRVVSLDRMVDRALEAALAPVAVSQVEAQLALRGSAAVTAGGVDVDVSMTLVASAGPGALHVELEGERELVEQRCRLAAVALSGSAAHDLDLAVEMLEQVVPAEVLADVDALLAALDPEPIAAELDALFASIVDAMPEFLTAVESELPALEARVRRLIHEFSPGTLMQRYVGVLDVVREEMSLLDPGRLADELGAVHAEVKAALLAYDPLVLAREVDGLVAQVAAALRGLDPAGLMPDLTGIETQVARVADILPVNALAGVGTQLTAVGDELRELDVSGMLDAVNSLVPEVAEAIALLIDAVRDEIVDVLESIRYAESNGSVSVSVSTEVA
ncbi:hypothetical protein FHX52_0805 [Humibacillus xanthopallidus]|uniref:Uncharacterized protein n=1 Tax=Humibacillus xanthopallidus TaxID=412689 RepID=A0A543PUG5_9MICO|nr:hypothetical protein [Humibacillus xanthopallidus]TQN47696.1 hypothetical protein FHX52_0805 [Humibacillus xanthopallidus]